MDDERFNEEVLDENGKIESLDDFNIDNNPKEKEKKKTKDVIIINTPDNELTKKELKKKKNLEALLEYGNGRDIKYRGPLGIRGIKIVAWVFMAFLAVGISMGLYYYVNKSKLIDNDTYNIIWSIAGTLGELAVPCFMLSKFAIILKNGKGYVKNLLVYGGLAAAIVAGFYVLYFHFGLEIAKAIASFSEDANPMDGLNGIFAIIMNKKIAFNVFIDMFLWFVFFTFFEYTPKILENRKAGLIAYRLCSLLPIIYVLITFVFKVLYSTGDVFVPPYLLILFPVTTPLVFVSLMVISLIMKNRKKKYIRIGGTTDNYDNYVKSNAGSFYFAKVTAIVFLVTGLVEFVFALILAIITGSDATVITLSGIGNCFAYVLFAPLILLFSYTRDYKNDKIDVVIPLAGIGIVVFIIVEGIFRIILSLIS